MAQKKSFKADLSPAMQFISTPAAEETPAPIREEAPAGYKVNPLFIEKRSKRLQLLVQPSIYDQIKALADAERCSVNDWIHRALENAVKGD